MSYNSDLQSYNTKIQNLINKANSLPDKESADPVLQSKTVTPSVSSQTITADSGYDGLETVTVNAMPTATQATPSITINANGLITASATQTAGYVVAGTKSGTKQLTTQAAKTITPSTTSQTAVSKGYYTSGDIIVAAVPTQTKNVTPTSTTQNITPDSGKFLSKVTVAGDSNLISSNIVAGKSIFGVSGSATVGNGGVDTSDATAVASDILLDKTAYANGNKITGTFTIEDELTEQEALLLELDTILSQSASKSETWILTLTDGSTVSKEVALYDN